MLKLYLQQRSPVSSSYSTNNLISYVITILNQKFFLPSAENSFSLRPCLAINMSSFSFIITSLALELENNTFVQNSKVLKSIYLFVSQQYSFIIIGVFTEHDLTI